MIYAEVEGRLVELNVKNGEWVTKDTVLAKLSNPEKQKELLAEAARPGGQLRTSTCGSTRAPSARAGPRPMQHKEIADKLEPIIKKITDQIGKLTLVASRDGQVVGRRTRDVGQWLKPGKPSDPESSPTSRTSARSATRTSSRRT